MAIALGMVSIVSIWLAAPRKVRAVAGRGNDVTRSDRERHGTMTVMAPIEELPDWERLLTAERHLERFEEVLATLEAVAGWSTERVQRPVLILGQLDGILTGVRQLRRTRPLETEEVAGLRVPTLAEMTRIKAWLLVTRNTVRDYLDTVVLCERLGDDGVVQAMRSFDAIYRQPTAASPLAEVVERLAAAAPVDATAVDLRRHRALQSPWTDWKHVAARGRHWAQVIAPIVLEANP